MVIVWVLAGLVAGIVAAELFRSLAMAWLFLGAGIGLILIDKKRFALLFFALAAGILCTIPHLDMLIKPECYYGQLTQFKVKSVKLVQEADEYYAWQGIIHEPKEIAGSKVIIYSQEYMPGIYTLSGTLFPPVQYRNPGQGWHYKRKIYLGEAGVLLYPRVVNFQPVQLSVLDRVRGNFRSNIYSNLGGSDGSALALALTTGDRSLMDKDMKSAVYLTGVGHIMALSGLHVSIIAGLLLLALRKLGLNRVFASAAAVLLLVLYLGFVGPAPSLIRAVLMSAYSLTAVLVGRERYGVAALLWAGFAMLMYNPLWLFDYAFIYSLLATYICIVAGNRLEKYLAFLPEGLRKTASVSLIVQITALPLSIYLFGSFPLLAPLTNLIIIPLMPLLTVLSLGAGLFSGTMGMLISWPAEQVLTGVANILSLLNQFAFSLKLGGIYLAFAGAACACLLLYLAGAGKKIVISGLVLSLMLFPLHSIWINQTSSIWFFDVGQGDSVLIRKNSQWILIDCGDNKAGAWAVVPAMKFLGVDRLTAVIITHPHADHVGGLNSVLENFSVDVILVNNNFADSEWFDPELPTKIVRNAEPVERGLSVYSHGLSLTNINDTSLLAMLECWGIRVLFTGDIEVEGERLYYNRISAHQILKVPHHGSNTSSSPTFVERVKPESAIISCGLGNSFGLPRVETLNNLEEAGAVIYRTDLSGCIQVIIWPWSQYSIVTFRGD